MSANLSTACSKCHAPLNADVPGKLCLKCLLSFGLKIELSNAEGEPESQPPLTTDTFGNYRLLEKIGEGGCGVVYRAEQIAPVRRVVALKVIKLGMDTQAVIARFETERQALALMEHPHIAKVLDAGASSNGRPFFVMELVSGERITDYCDRHRLPIPKRLELFIAVCSAIQHAHQKGIIHRDIKPANILVIEQDGRPVPKVIDFGIARATTSQRLADESIYTAFDQFVGTPAYMSPEQTGLLGDNVDTRTDIYALGVLLYELLTGRLPFDFERLRSVSLDEMCRIIRQEEPPKPSDSMIVSSAGALTNAAGQDENAPCKLSELRKTELDSITLKALEKNPDRRYATADGMAKDVCRFLAGEPVLAQPPSQLYRTRKFIQRNKITFGAGIAIFLALLLGLVATTWMHFRERAARKMAVQSEGEQVRLREVAERAQTTAVAESARASLAARQAKHTLSASDFRQAVRHISEGKRSFALAYLNRSLAANPTNQAALTRLITLITYNTWIVPKLVIGLEEPPRDLTQTALKRPATVSVDESAPESTFSPDGSKLAITWGNTIWIRDAHTGSLLTHFWSAEGNIASSEFSSDSRRLLTSSHRFSENGPTNSTIQVWDTEIGEVLTAPLRNDDCVCKCRYSPDGKYVLELPHRTPPRIWNLETKELLAIPPELGFPAGFSPDSSKILVVSPPIIRVVDVKTMSQLLVVDGLSGKFHNAEFSGGGDLILAADEYRIQVWEVQTGKRVCEIPVKAQDVHFNANAKRITCVLLPNRACVWDAGNGTMIGPGVQFDGDIVSASFDADGKKAVVTTHHATSAQVWDMDSGRMIADSLEHFGAVDSAQFSPDGKSIATGSRDGITKVWNFFGSPPSSVRITTTQTNDNFDSVRFHPDGNRLLLASGIDKEGRLLSEYGTVQIWNSEKAVALTPIMQHASGLRFAQFSRDGLKVLTLSPKNGARVWNANTGSPITGWLKGGDWNDSAVLSPDGKWLASTFSHKVGPNWWSVRAAQIWSAETGAPISEPWTNCYSVDFSPDSQTVVVATTSNVCIRSVTNGKQVRLIASNTSTPNISYFNNADGTQRQQLPASPFFDSATFRPDGKAILAARNNLARLWDAKSGMELTAFGSTGDNWIKAQFSPDGRQILTVVAEKTARIWDAASGKPLTDPLIHEGFIMAAQFSSDGNKVATASFDKTARVWDSESLIPITDPFPCSDRVRSVDISPDGRRVAAVSGNECQIWDIAPAGTNFPSWLLRLSEALAGQIVSEQGVLTPTSMDRALEIENIRNELANRSATDDWSVWGRWFFANPANRTLSPFAGVIASDRARK